MRPNRKARPEQANPFHHAWDANCSQHVLHRIDTADVAARLGERDSRIRAPAAGLREHPAGIVEAGLPTTTNSIAAEIDILGVIFVLQMLREEPHDVHACETP
jgi:hypothetical protein